MPEILPLTNDALSFHIKQANCQAAVWQLCHLQHPQPPPPETMGWRLEDSVFVSVLKSLPSGPDACADLIIRACTKQCTRISCKCRMSRLPCTVTCKCHDSWQYLLQRLKNDEMLHPLTLCIKCC